jgi:hypothetical protein
MTDAVKDLIVDIRLEIAELRQKADDLEQICKDWENGDYI